MSTMSPDQIERFERWLLEELPIVAEHVPDAETRAFDARVLEPVMATNGLRIIGRSRIDPGTPLELKTCQLWISDNGSGNGRRRGTWQLKRGAHRELVEVGGIYACIVMDDDEIVEFRLVDPEQLEESIITSWTNCGNGMTTSRAHISWGSLIDPSSTRGGVVSLTGVANATD